MKNLALAFGGMISVGLFMGVLLSWKVSVEASDNSQNWQAPTSPLSLETTIANAKNDILQSGHFGSVPVATTAITKPAQEETGPPAFPTILSGAGLDGDQTITVRLADGTLRTFREGEQIDGGWLVTEISLQEIVVEQNGERAQFPVFPGISLEQISKELEQTRQKVPDDNEGL